MKNILRNRRRTSLNVISLALGIFMMVFGLSWGQGYHSYVYTAMRNFEAGDAQILNRNYLEEERRLPLDLAVSDTRRVVKSLTDTNIVKTASPRIDFSVKVSNRMESTRLLGRGVSQAEGEVTVIRNQITEGRFFTDTDRGVLLGEDLARRMKLNIGDTLYLTAIDRHGTENFMSLKLTGIFKFGFPPIDRQVIFVDIESARSLLDMRASSTRIVVRFTEGTSITEGLEILNEKLANTELTAYSWERFAQETVSAVQSDMGSFYVFILILYMMIIIGMYNSMSMTVRERTGEIGTMRAIGARRSDIIVLLLFESIAISCIAIIAGYLLAAPFMYYLTNIGIDISSSLPDSVPVPFGERFYADIEPLQFLLAFAIGIASGITGTLIPAVRASRLSITDSLGAKKHG